MRDPATGAIIRGKFRTLKLDELSSVDVPAQSGALALIMKRADSPILKYVDTEDGAITFGEALEELESERKHWAANDKIWPVISACSDSIRSIIGDGKIEWSAKQTKLRETVEAFLVEVATKAPEVEAELAKYLDEGVIKMSDIAKKLEDAEAALAKANDEITTLKASLETVTAEKAKAEEDKTKSDKELDDLKKRGDDEIIKVGDTEVRKSVVGDASFAVHKAQQAEMAKVNDGLLMANLEKRATDEFALLPGTSLEKAAILKAAIAMPEDVKKGFEAIMKSAAEMAKNGFAEMGTAFVEKQQTVQKAKGDFMAEVRKIAKRDEIPEYQAMQKARTEHADLFKTYQKAEDQNKIAA